MIPITPSEAEQEGFVSITTPFSDEESELLWSAVKGLEECDIRLVRVSPGIEIWRRKSDVATEEGCTASAASIKIRIGRRPRRDLW